MELLPSRVLPDRPVVSLADHRRIGGCDGLAAARDASPDEVIDAVAASGLRGRGGAGFPTGTKWRTVAMNRSSVLSTTVVVNGAEGEPGTFKDRTLMRANPFRVVEGALIAAHAVGADMVVFALKAEFTDELERIRNALAEMTVAGLTEGLNTAVVEGPSEYLFGEETALLEVIAGRRPFPRVAPPYRAGVEATSPARSPMAAEGDATEAPPTLVNNVETIANVPAIVARGADWFRELGTTDSPGTLLCTVTGDVQRHGVAELEMGTALTGAIDLIGGGPRPGHSLTGAVSGVANPVLPADLLATPLTYEDMEAAGSGLGSAGFTVIDDETDVVAVAEGMARFLAVESCGQCTPCKSEGLGIAADLHQLRRDGGSEALRRRLAERIAAVPEEARCHLAHQQAAVSGSFLSLFPDELPAAGEVGRMLTVAPIVDIVDGRAVFDEHQATKQPDWSHDENDSGVWPAAGHDVSMAEVAIRADRP